MDITTRPYKFKTVHISGKSNVVADCLTRQFEDPSEQSFSGLALQKFLFQLVRGIFQRPMNCYNYYVSVVD
jgi:hypothetical protein